MNRGLVALRRRADLINWIEERPTHDGLTAGEIADVSGIYEGHGRADRCFDDLKAMRDFGHLRRESGRPARWFATWKAHGGRVSYRTTGLGDG